MLGVRTRRRSNHCEESTQRMTYYIALATEVNDGRVTTFTRQAMSEMVGRTCSKRVELMDKGPYAGKTCPAGDDETGSIRR